MARHGICVHIYTYNFVCVYVRELTIIAFLYISQLCLLVRLVPLVDGFFPHANQAVKGTLATLEVVDGFNGQPLASLDTGREGEEEKKNGR